MIARKDPAYSRRIDQRLAVARVMDQVGRSAAYHCQIVSLGLQPWETPPCFSMARPAISDHERASRDLLKRMIDAGVSRWHPDPLLAISEAEQRRTKWDR